MPTAPQVLEINPSHPLIVSLDDVRTKNPRLADLVAKQVFDNAMIAAGIVEDARSMLPRLQTLLQAALSSSAAGNAATTGGVAAEKPATETPPPDHTV